MESGAEQLPQFSGSGLVSISLCLLLSIIYVSSLYVWSSKQCRDHPSTIKKRFFSVFVVMLIAPLFVYFTASRESLHQFTIWQLIGFRREEVVRAFVVPLILTALLFLGPIVVCLCNGTWREYTQLNMFTSHLTNVIWLRNHLVAPFSEEFTFRACMIPILIRSFKPMTTVMIQPLFFGVAHLHHMVEKLRSGMDKKTAILTSCFQFLYTSIFGMYSAYLFIRTGHFIAPFIVHAFCNHMGFPDIQQLFDENRQKRIVFTSFYVLGFCTWLLLLPILTNPVWYSNYLYINDL